MSTLSKCNQKKLQDAIAGGLNERGQQELEAHLLDCKNCQRQIQRFAADDNEWKKISDYFSRNEYPTEPFSNELTVDIQLNNSPNSNSSYELIEPLAPRPTNHSDVLEPASHPENLGRIDGFEIEQMIGRGGMGIVYKGFDTELNRPVAIKVLADHLASNGVARQRFAREARAAAAVMHPNVVPIHSVNSAAKRPYIVMTLVSGRSLQAHVSKNGALPVKDIVRIGKQIAAGLAAAHREGLVHRDIKPANILLEKDVSRVMITDFGLARAADDAAITQTGWLAGTPHYMSPEQASGREVDQRSDLFSLGSVLYFMATGREPFRAEIPVAVLQKITSQIPTAARSVNSETTKTLGNIIDRLMQKQPEHRFQSAVEVEQVLTKYLAHLEQPRSQPKPKIKNLRNARRLRLAICVLAPLVLLGAWAGNAFLSIQGEEATIDGTNDSTKVQTASQQNIQPPPEWMQDLQSPESWNHDISELEKDIQQLEQIQSIRPMSYGFDPFANEQHSLNATIERIEQTLGQTQ